MPYKNPLPYRKRATPARCGILAARLLRIVGQLEGAGVTVPGSARLRREARLLADVAANRAFPTGRPERRQIGNGVRDVHEFQRIVKLAGVAGTRGLATELQAAMKGTPDRSERNRKPYQFQSQLWIGSVFLHSSTPATVVPPGPEPAPDFLLDVEGRPYGLEVKRPASTAGIPDALSHAREQLSAQALRGGVAFDVSDCIPDELLFVHDDDPHKPPYSRMTDTFAELHRACQHVLSDQGRARHRPGYERICFLIVYAHGWRWTRRGPSGPEPFSASEFGCFVTAPGNAAHRDAERIRAAYIAGLTKAGLYVTRET